MAEIENIRVVPSHDPDSRYSLGGEVDMTEFALDPLDSPEKKKKLGKLEDWFAQERMKQAENRFQMALDQDFYDGLQYSTDDAQELIDRGQAPLVYNEIKPTIDWVVGTERRTKFDFNVLPRKDADVEMAGIKRDVLKYVSDINRIPFERSQAFKESVISGVSWTEDGVCGDNDNDPLFSQHESWRNVWYDSNSIKMDLSDARYLFRRKVLDLDVAIAMFPSREQALRSVAMDQNVFTSYYDDDYYLGQPLKQSANGTTPMGGFSRYGGSGIGTGTGQFNRRERVELIEAWVRMPVRVQKLRGDIHDGELYDENNPSHAAAVGDGVVSIVDALELTIEVSVFCKGAMLFDGKSPYKHKRFALTPIWCFRRGRDNAPYGVVRNIRDPQEDLNKRGSKALFILSTNQVIAEENAVDDWDILREEVSRPDGIIIKKKGKELEIRQDKQLAEEHLKMMDRDGNSIRNAGGVTDENLGRGSNAQSGRAIIARQTQGSVVTAEIFDNYLLSFQIQGENLLSLTEQFYTAEKVIRLTGDKNGKYDWRQINQPQPDGSYLNDITQTKADFLVDEQDYRETIRQAMFEQMMDMVSKMPPEMAINLLDLVFEYSDVQGKDEIVARIRKLNGQGNDKDKKTPEEMQAMQEAEVARQEQIALAKRTAEANVALLEGKVSQQDMLTQKADAERINKMIEAIYASIQAGNIVASSPGTAPVSDEILRSAGYKDSNGSGAPISEPGAQAAAAQLAPASPVAKRVQRGTDPRQTTLFPPTPEQEVGVRHGIETTRNDGAVAQV